MKNSLHYQKIFSLKFSFIFFQKQIFIRIVNWGSQWVVESWKQSDPIRADLHWRNDLLQGKTYKITYNFSAKIMSWIWIRKAHEAEFFFFNSHFVSRPYFVVAIRAHVILFLSFRYKDSIPFFSWCMDFVFIFVKTLRSRNVQVWYYIGFPSGRLNHVTDVRLGAKLSSPTVLPDLILGWAWAARNRQIKYSKNMFCHFSFLIEWTVLHVT